MEAKAGNRASPDWRALYEAAVLELDLEKIPARIAEAQRAVMNRMEDQNRSDGSESEVLKNTLKNPFFRNSGARNHWWRCRPNRWRKIFSAFSG
jgi:hypothetical protein